MTAKRDTPGRTKQRLRTRKELLAAAALLIKDGRKPTLAEVADAALVSRATAYRYFSSVELLLAEVGLDQHIPAVEDVFARDASRDAVERVWKADQAINKATFENHLTARLTLVALLQQSIEKAGGESDTTPVRQNRRASMIAAALAPVRDQFRRSEFENLCAALALFIGIESMVVFKDVLRMDDAKAEKVRRWGIRALIEAAKKPDTKG